MTNFDSLRSSRSSYGDQRYPSAFSNGTSSGVPPKGMADGYRSVSVYSIDAHSQSQYSRASPLPSRSAPAVDVTDPVLMHLLTETAIGDSAGYEILPFEDVEDLKRQHKLLSARIEATKRKLALETKLRDAAQSLCRLPRKNGEAYTNGTTTNGVHHDDDLDGDADAEFAESSRKCEELSQELWTYERQAHDVYKRLLEHTAGILQLTHRGLKKRGGQNKQGVDGVDRGSAAFEFDERSFYKTADGLDDVAPDVRIPRSGDGQMIDANAARDAEQKLEELNSRLRNLILQNHTDAELDPLPNGADNGASSGFPARVQAHLAYLENSLHTIELRGLHTGGAGPSTQEIEEEISQVNSQLSALLVQSGSALSPSPPPPSPTGDHLHTHLEYLRNGLQDLQRRVEGLQEQKSILTTQIQQQRELNSKSDAERDAHIADLTAQLMEARKANELSEREAKAVREELSQLMEQLDEARQQLTLQDQKREQDITAAVDAERAARQKVEDELSRLRQAAQEAMDNKAQADAEISQLRQAVQEAKEARTQAEKELRELEGEVARAQTELTVVKAELDGAYGTRAERAAEAAANPALQRELEELHMKNINLTEELAALKAEQANRRSANNDGQRVEILEKELRDTIEDYEVMTKASIEFEKERERYESTIDGLRDRIEQLETQLSEERIALMGLRNNAGRDGMMETTSMMVLKNEFKKMMRDTRAENMKLLKAEQEERRRLEALVRSLRKEQMGRSSPQGSTAES
ncbi:hypothetical protein VTN31DRAFT_6000 [Thermomyces dupontii]|uniref:uncharacterized protein n=1 Tax=Talaromyces thermophilus TaxID=28565 RepID=UPI003742692A